MLEGAVGLGPFPLGSKVSVRKAAAGIGNLQLNFSE